MMNMKRKIFINLISLALGITFAGANDSFQLEKRDIVIPYITKNGDVDRRTVRVLIPETAQKPVPLIFFAHYPTNENAADVIEFFNKGWAIAMMADFKGAEHNSALTDDNLVFNSAALSVVRKLPEIDRTRIGVMGGSAGGYTSLMLSALHLGICSSVSIAGITNIRFNIPDYFVHAHSYNLREIEKLNADERNNMERRLEVMPIPVLGSIFDIFIPLTHNFPDPNDADRWAAFSPSSLTGCFSNPVLHTHFTSDILVPVDQVTKKYTYPNGSTLPAGFKLRLSQFDLPEKLQLSMAEATPVEDLSERLVTIPEGSILIPEFDVSKRLNIIVYDEGPVEATAGHQKHPTGYFSFTNYFETHFARTSRLTNLLTVDKLALLAERYAGRCIQLPVRQTTDETLYGSAARYRADVMDELTDYAKSREKDKLTTVFQKTAAKRPDLSITLDEIITALYKTSGEDKSKK